MEREASFLRCSKLSCYVEFNKMVQSMALHGRDSKKGDSLTTKQGTSAEYNFYRTLSIMLHQVLSNPNSDSQHKELLMIYQWYSLNKPLTLQKVKTTATRPKLAMQKWPNGVSQHGRPHTAPASLGNTGSGCRGTPICPPPTPANNTVPGFTSSYMKKSAKLESKHTRPHTQPTPTSARAPSRALEMDSQYSMASKTDGVPTAGQVYSIATGVAAQMSWERITSPWRTPLIPHPKNAIHHNTPVKQIPGPAHKDHTHPSTPPPKHPQQEERKRPDTPSLLESKLETIMEEETHAEIPESGKYLSQNVTEQEVEVTLDQRDNKQDQMSEDKRISRQDERMSEQDHSTSIVPPVVTIDEKRKIQIAPPTPPPPPSSSVVSLHKCPHALPIVTLTLPQQLNNESTKARKAPKSLTPIVAGFNKQQYRPRTVA